MKKLFVWLLALSLLLFVACAVTLAEESAAPLEAEIHQSGNYKYMILNDGTVEITKYSGKERTISIPNQLDGLKVTSIGEKAFSYGDFTSVTIPEGVTNIGNSAFYCCDDITNISIPNGVISIGNLAFFQCESMSSFNIPDSVTLIGDEAFNRCWSLRKITIPDTVISMGKNPFLYCSKLKEIYVSADHPYLATIDGVLFSKPDKRLICYPCGFSSREYTIPDGIQIIGGGAFYWCKSLKSVTIPESVTIIGDEAFYYCESLADITIPEGVTRIGDSAFSNCQSISSITIPGSVISIGNKAFNNCYLDSVALSDGIASIGEAAFYQCIALTSIEIPQSVTDIGGNPFAGCSQLTEIKVSADHPYLDVIDGVLFSKPDMRLVCYPETLTSTDYIIPSNTRAIGNYAFSSTYVNNVTITDNVTTIGDNAFFWSHISSITIPDSVTTIGERAFFWCNSLKNITIPASVTSIGKLAFERDKITVNVYHDSYAAEYCKNNNLNASYPDSQDWLNN